MLLAAGFGGFSASAQSKIDAVTDTGRIDGVRYKIVFPPNWNKKKLVMWAHGMETVGSNPHIFDWFHIPNIKPFLLRGYAVAASSYRQQGYALPQGVDDTEALRQFFEKKYGKPDTAFIVGQSMGGGVTMGTIEYKPQYYNGALATCPVSSPPYVHMKWAFDLNIMFAALFPGSLGPIADVMNGKAKPGDIALMKKALNDNPEKAAFLAHRYELNVNDLANTTMFKRVTIANIAMQAGGSPFDNTNTLYDGFPDDWDINNRAERVAADSKAEKFFEPYNRTGKLTKPVIILHTVYDELVPASLAVINYDNLARINGSGNLLAVKYTKGKGHCKFTEHEMGVAFDELRKWAGTGKKTVSGRIE